MWPDGVPGYVTPKYWKFKTKLPYDSLKIAKLKKRLRNENDAFADIEKYTHEDGGEFFTIVLYDTEETRKDAIRYKLTDGLIDEELKLGEFK